MNAIEYGIPMPTRGPRRKYSGKIPLKEMKVNGSYLVTECHPDKRTPVQITVENAIAYDTKVQQINGVFKVTTRKLSEDKCEVRAWRLE